MFQGCDWTHVQRERKLGEESEDSIMAPRCPDDEGRGGRSREPS